MIAAAVPPGVAPLDLRDVVDVPTGHADRPVAKAVLDGRAVVVKRFADERVGWSAWRDQRALWHSPAGRTRRPPVVPEPIAYRPCLVVMEALDGAPIGRRGDLGESVVRAGEAAALLADLHRSGASVPRQRPWARVLRSMARKADELGTPDARRALDALRRTTVVGGPLVVGHGDWSPRNVLSTPAGLRAIDVDRLAMADPARDVAYWGAWAWATLLLAGGTPTWDVADAYQDAYERCTGTPLADVAAYRAAALVRIAHGWSALAADPTTRERVLAEVVTVLAD